MTPWTVARQAPLFMEFSRQEYWNGLPFPLHGSFPTQLSCIAGRFSTIWATREDSVVITFMCPGKRRNLCDLLYYSGLEPKPQQLWDACIYGECENMSLKDSATGGSCRNRKEMSAKEAPRRKGQEEQGCCYCCWSLSSVWLCDLMDCSPPGSSVHGTSQKRILEWVAISSSNFLRSKYN